MLRLSRFIYAVLASDNCLGYTLQESCCRHVEHLRTSERSRNAHRVAAAGGKSSTGSRNEAAGVLKTQASSMPCIRRLPELNDYSRFDLSMPQLN